MKSTKYIQKFLSYPQTRDIYFDNIKGKLILLVVLGHLLEFKLSYNPIRFLYVFLYSFVMPTFVFVSGLFFKPKLKNILKIFLIYCVAQLILLLYKKQIYNISFHDFLTPVWTLWYLLSLFYWSSISLFLKKIRCSELLLLGGALIIALSSGFFRIGYFLSLQRACAFSLFFTLGMYINKERLKKVIGYLKKRKVYLCFILSLCILLLIYQNSYLPRAFYDSFSYFSFKGYAEWYMFFIRFLQFILSLILGSFLFKNTKDNKNIYTWCGYYSLWIYLLHTFILYFFK